MKKKKVMPKRWAKPSKDERDTFYGTLESVEILHCGVCFKQDDMESSDILYYLKLRLVLYKRLVLFTAGRNSIITKINAKSQINAGSFVCPQ